MKWIGAVVIISSSFFIGWRKSKMFSDRVSQIRRFETALITLESAIAFGAESIETTIRSIAASTEQPVGNVFKCFADQLSASDQSAGQLWKKTLQQHAHQLALKKEDIQIVEQAGHKLGLITQEAEKRKIKHVLRQLEKQREEAIAAEQRFSGMIRTVSVLAGMMTAILLM